MALEAARSTRFKEMLSALDHANEQYTVELRSVTRSLLLYRIAGSLDKKKEISFLYGIILRIQEESENPELAEVTSEIDRLFTEGVEGQSVTSLYSSTAYVADVISVSDLYRLITELRKEPLNRAESS